MSTALQTVVARPAAAPPPSKAGTVWRMILGGLVAANLAAAALMMFPPGGSADEVERQYAALQSQVAARRALLARTRQNVAAVAQGRGEGDDFLKNYFLARRTAYSTLLGELITAADQAQIKPREHAYVIEPIEGSDTLSMMTITANYEGTYANLMKFVNAIDRSPRLLIVEGLNAAPQQNNILTVNMKIDAFVREDGSGDLAVDANASPAITPLNPAPKNAPASPPPSPAAADSALPVVPPITNLRPPRPLPANVNVAPNSAASGAIKGAAQ